MKMQAKQKANGQRKDARAVKRKIRMQMHENKVVTETPANSEQSEKTDTGEMTRLQTFLDFTFDLKVERVACSLVAYHSLHRVIATVLSLSSNQSESALVPTHTRRLCACWHIEIISK